MEKKQKFYEMGVPERLVQLAVEAGLDEGDLDVLSGKAGLSTDLAERMIENVIGIYALPLGIARNFVVNGREMPVPMVIEEPSVVAAASYMAKLARAGGGFKASASPPEMIGQVQVLDVKDTESAAKALEKQKDAILKAADVDEVLRRLGGGPRELSVRIISEAPAGPFLVLHIVMDVRNAMGANAVNTALEKITPMVEKITGGRALLRILTNLADRRLARASCTIPPEALKTDTFSGEDVRDRIIEASAFAEADTYRAATHNKGIMNGVDAVVIATGNDWRAVEAGAHAYAARGGRYTSLSRWSQAGDAALHGELEMPMAVGTVGGATRVHPTAWIALKMMGVQSARELAEIIVSVGLAQNLGALRALATEGIQQGHMALHARQVAIAAGASPELAEAVAGRMVEEDQVNLDRAREILQERSREK